MRRLIKKDCILIVLYILVCLSFFWFYRRLFIYDMDKMGVGYLEVIKTYWDYYSFKLFWVVVVIPVSGMFSGTILICTVLMAKKEKSRCIVVCFVTVILFVINAFAATYSPIYTGAMFSALYPLIYFISWFVYKKINVEQNLPSQRC